MFKLLSWNIQQGGGGRQLAIAQKLIEFDAHVIVLSEFHNHKVQLFTDTLLKAGYAYQYFTNAISTTNSVFIASKLPAESKLFPEADLVFSQNIMSVTFSAFGIMGMYLPHKKKHSLLGFLKNMLQYQALPFILVGDFNTGHNFIDQKGDSFWYEKELIALENEGYVDAFRHINGTVQEYSWYSHQGNGYRYDHSYVHKSLVAIVKKCYYLHDWRLQKLSDHSPMVLELG